MFHAHQDRSSVDKTISYQCTHCHSSWILHYKYIQKSRRCLHRWSVLDMFHWSHIHSHLWRIKNIIWQPEWIITEDNYFKKMRSEMTKTMILHWACTQLTNAYMAETSFSQLLRIDWFYHVPCSTRSPCQMTKPHLTNAHTAIPHESFIAGAYKRAKGVCTGGVFWTGSIGLTFIYICGYWRKRAHVKMQIVSLAKKLFSRGRKKWGNWQIKNLVDGVKTLKCTRKGLIRNSE